MEPAPTSEPSLRDRKRARTRMEIARAAYRRFARQGFDGTTVDEIAADAMVSRRTFFRYFPTKEAVVFPHDSERVQRFRDSLAECPPDKSGFEAVRHAALAMASELMANRDEMVAQHDLVESTPSLLAYERELDQGWQRAIADAFEARDGGGETAGRRARVLAGAAMGAIRVTLDEWFASDGKLDLVRLANEGLDLIEHGTGLAQQR